MEKIANNEAMFVDLSFESSDKSICVNDDASDILHQSFD